MRKNVSSCGLKSFECSRNGLKCQKSMMWFLATNFGTGRWSMIDMQSFCSLLPLNFWNSKRAPLKFHQVTKLLGTEIHHQPFKGKHLFEKSTQNGVKTAKDSLVLAWNMWRWTWEKDESALSSADVTEPFYDTTISFPHFSTWNADGAAWKKWASLAVVWPP